MRAGLDDDPPTPSGNPLIEGTLTAAGGTSDPAALILTGSTGVICDKPVTNTEWVCEIMPTAVAPLTLTVTGYNRDGKVLSICSDELTLDAAEYGGTTATNWTRFFLPGTDLDGVTLHISKSGC